MCVEGINTIKGIFYVWWGYKYIIKNINIITSMNKININNIRHNLYEKI